jgi:C-terminal processing protease CtpA/Prc
MPSTVSALTAGLATWIERLMPDTARRTALLDALRTGFADRHDPLTAETCAQVAAAAQQHSRHLILSFDPTGTALPDRDRATGWPLDDEAEVRARAAAVTEVRRVPVDGGGHASIIRIDGLESLSIAQPYLDAAFTLTRGARRVVLDLRGNGGGDPATVAYICGWLLDADPAHSDPAYGTSVPLSEVHYRGHIRQWWSTPFPTDRRAPGDVPVDVLISDATFSSGEALAYHLQARGRVRVIGQRSRGGADHVTLVQLTATTTGQVPEGYVVDTVSGGNWEGTGVRPDVECPAPDALDTSLGGT